jgi:hypothetical protein
MPASPVESAAELPPFRVIAAALRATTESLAREIAEPQHTPPDWGDFEWVVARAACAMQGIAGVLASRLRWTGPGHWQSFLTGQRDEVTATQAQVRRVLARLDATACAVSVPFIALKGSALLALGLHPAGERPMGDIDVLVEPAQLVAMSQAILASGYETGFDMRRHRVFFPKSRANPQAYGDHRDNPLRVELHTHISEPLPYNAVPITDSLWPRAPRPGLNAYASLAALMRHNLLHAAGNMRAHALRYIQLYDIAALARRMRSSDWRELSAGPTGQPAWWMFPPLELSDRYLPGNIPTAELAHAEASCPPLLRWKSRQANLYEVSWSNLRVAAFPGVEWSRTPLEALRFARSRLLPSAVALDELAAGVEAAPAMRQTPWYELPHGQRIVRWLFSHPPRVQTLSAVSAALQAEAS